MYVEVNESKPLFLYLINGDTGRHISINSCLLWLTNLFDLKILNSVQYTAQINFPTLYILWFASLLRISSLSKLKVTKSTQPSTKTAAEYMGI